MHVVADRERASTEGPHREFRCVQDRVTVSSRTQRGGAFGEMGFGDVSELFPQLIGAGETEVTDLVQAAGAGLAAGTLRDQQRPDRFDVAVRGFRDPRRPARQRGAGRFDRVDRIGLALHAADLTVGAIDLDHDQPARLEIARQARAIRAGALDPDSCDRTERAQPVVQRDEPDGALRERLDTEHTAVRVERGGDMVVEVGVDSTRDRARRIYDGHCHPFSLQRLRGGTHVP